MKSFTITLLSIIVIASCTSSIKINQHIETISDQIKIETTVNMYIIEDGKYYGSITSTNKTEDTLIFNFNQSIIVAKDTMIADYNILPISYAMQAFYILPNSIKTWNVAWNSKTHFTDPDKLILIADTNIQTLAEKRAEGFIIY